MTIVSRGIFQTVSLPFDQVRVFISGLPKPALVFMRLQSIPLANRIICLPRDHGQPVALEFRRRIAYKLMKEILETYLRSKNAEIDLEKSVCLRNYGDASTRRQALYLINRTLKGFFGGSKIKTIKAAENGRDSVISLELKVPLIAIEDIEPVKIPGRSGNKA